MIFHYFYFVVYDRKPTDSLYLVRIMPSTHSSIFHFFVFYQLDGQIETVKCNFSGNFITSFSNLFLVVVW
jgi:hypothetical protein